MVTGTGFPELLLQRQNPALSMTKRDHQLVPSTLGFFGNDDRTTIVEAAIRTGSMLQLLFVAVRAFSGRRHSRFVVSAALSPAGL